MKLKKGDKVIVIAGKDKGKEGRITKILKSENKVIVENINLIKKHKKSDGQNPGSIIEMEAPIDASKVMFLDPKTKKGTKIKHTIDKNNKKIRVSKSSEVNID